MTHNPVGGLVDRWTIPFSPLSSFRSLNCDPASGGFITDSTTATQPLERTGVLSSVTSFPTAVFGDDSAGDTTIFKITLTNTGTTTLTMISVSSAALVEQER